MDKIKLNSKETENLTAIKIDDVKQVIKDTQFVLDELYYDKRIAYMPHSTQSLLINPVEDIYKLIESIEFMMDKYVKNKWERNDELDNREKQKLYEVIFGLRQALHNSIANARLNSQFKDKYVAWWEASNENLKTSAFTRAQEKLENKIKEEAGWIPRYDKGQIYYSYYMDYNNQHLPLDSIERDDGKQILSPEIVKERMERGF